MDSFVHLAEAISPLAAGLIVASIWQSMLVAAAVIAGVFAFPSVSPAGRTRLWTVVLVVVLLLPLLNLVLPHSPEHSHAAIHVARSWSVALLAAWALVALARAALVATQAVRMNRLAARAVPAAASPELLCLSQGSRSAELCTTPEIDRPSVAGFLHPRILLPEGLLETLSYDELEHVVLHEMEHLRRHDDWMNLLQQISLVLFPLNPVLFWLDRRLCRERELACDDGVLATTRAYKAYAACLVKLAEDSMVRRGLTLALSALGTRAGKSDLVTRVRRILAGPDASVQGKTRRFAPVILSVAALALATLLARSPQWVSFTVPSEAAVAASVAQPQTPAVGLNGSAELASFRMAETMAGKPRLIQAAFHEPARGATRARRSSPRLRTAVVYRQLSQFRPAASLVPEQGSKPWSLRAIRTDASPTPPSPSSSGQPAYVPARVVVTGFEASQPVIAAVPVRGGWLILQL